MKTNVVKVRGVLHEIKQLENTVYYVDIDYKATSAPTKEELIEKLKQIYGDAEGYDEPTSGDKE